jgi:hypothetical protein
MFLEIYTKIRINSITEDSLSVYHKKISSSVYLHHNKDHVFLVKLVKDSEYGRSCHEHLSKYFPTDRSIITIFYC